MPEKKLTRAELITMLMRAVVETKMMEDVDTNLSSYDTLSLESSEKLYDSIIKAVKSGISTDNLSELGLPDTKTKEKSEYISFLQNYLSNESFNWAKRYMNFAYTKGLINEYQYLGLDYFTNKNISKEDSETDKQIIANAGGCNIKVRRDDAAYIICDMLVRNILEVTVPLNVYKYSKDISCERNAYWNTDTAFVDVTRSYPFCIEEIYQMYMNGLMEGDTERRFNPDKILTRAEACAVIVRSLFSLAEGLEKVDVLEKGSANYIDFSLSETQTITQALDRSDSGEFYFVAPKTGYYYISDMNGCNVTVNDMRNREIKGLEAYDSSTQITNGARYNIRRGETAYINVKSIGNEYSFKITQPQEGELVFAPDRTGTFIYDNNHESIRKENVINITDNELINRSWIMSNKKLKPGRYVVFSSHNNETCYNYYSDSTNESLWGSGFDIYLDALITCYNGAKVILTNAGYWTSLPTDSIAGISWSGLHAYSDFTKEVIHEISLDKGSAFNYETLAKPSFDYTPTKRLSDNVNLNFVNNICWLSEGIEQMYGENYIQACKEGRPVFFVAEFTVMGDDNSYIDLNIGALKRKNYSDNIADYRELLGSVSEGEFINQEQIKGISSTFPIVETELNYEIDDNTTYLPINVSNINNGYVSLELTENQNFVTHGAPKEDQSVYLKNNYVENDMLNFEYNGFNYNIYDGWLNSNGRQTYMLGNFGVKNIYNIKVKNNSDKDKMFVYEMTTATNYMARIVSQVEGQNDTLTSGFYSRNEVEFYNSNGNPEQIKAPIKICKTNLVAGETTNVILEVWSPTNVRGCLENRFLIE